MPTHYTPVLPVYPASSKTNYRHLFYTSPFYKVQTPPVVTWGVLSTRHPTLAISSVLSFYTIPMWALTQPKHNSTVAAAQSLCKCTTAFRLAVLILTHAGTFRTTTIEALGPDRSKKGVTSNESNTSLNPSTSISQTINTHPNKTLSSFPLDTTTLWQLDPWRSYGPEWRLSCSHH